MSSAYHTTELAEAFTRVSSSTVSCRDEVISPSPLHTHTHTHTVGPNVTITSSPLDNNKVRLTCSARGYPVMDRVAWQTDGGATVSGSVDEINAMESATFDFSLTSTLDLERSRCNSHFYQCSVSSGSITRSTSITCQIGTCMCPCMTA